MYSNVRSRAGLVALVFALIISLVSAVPIPILAPQSGLSSTAAAFSRSSQNIIQGIGGIAQIPRNDPISTVSSKARKVQIKQLL